MAVRLQCPNPDCLASYSITEAELGRSLRCDKCGWVFELSSSGEDDPEPQRGSPTLLMELTPGAIFGRRYEILRPLGRGGMGVVYLARDAELGRDVALKIPQMAMDGGDRSELFRRFIHEARAAARFDHPNICPVYDVGQVDGVYYLTMAYIEGRPLTSLLGNGPLPESRAAEVVITLARALGEAHEHGIVHRDLKPSNILVSARRGLVIMDFGLARNLLGGDGTRITLSGQMLGTPGYMAPEQVRGDVEAVGPACDIFSLGVILYELLTGRRPFTGKVGEVLAKLLTENPEPPSRHRPGLDPLMEAICLKAMAKAPGDRYASMAEFSAALETCVAIRSQVESRPASAITEKAPATPNRRWRRSLLAGVASVAGLLLLAVAVQEAGRWPWRRLTHRVARPVVRSTTADALTRESTTISAQVSTSAPEPASAPEKIAPVVVAKHSEPEPVSALEKSAPAVVTKSATPTPEPTVERPKDKEAPVVAIAPVPPASGVAVDPAKSAPVVMAVPPRPPWFPAPLLETYKNSRVVPSPAPIPPPPSATGTGLAKVDLRPVPPLASTPRVIGMTPGKSPARLANVVGMTLVHIEPGEFTMGTSAAQLVSLMQMFPTAKHDLFKREQPAHRVRITRPFYLAIHPVTVRQFRRFVDQTGYLTEAEKDGKGGYAWNEAQEKWVPDPKVNWRSPGFPQGDDHPVVLVSWHDAHAFIDWLNKTAHGKLHYGLPTEAEWEYACRAGSSALYPNSDDPEKLALIANTADASARRIFPKWDTIRTDDGHVYTAPVGSYRPNANGLFDMIGNVWQWCQDGFDAEYYKDAPVNDPTGSTVALTRVVRGGGWSTNARGARSAVRNMYTPGYRSGNLGFRVTAVQTGVARAPGAGR